jgi:hypothetical protein
MEYGNGYQNGGSRGGYGGGGVRGTCYNCTVTPFLCSRGSVHLLREWATNVCVGNEPGHQVCHSGFVGDAGPRR